MSSSSTVITRKTRSTNIIDGSNILDDFHSNLHSSTQFINIYNQYFQSQINRSLLIHTLSNILILENLDKNISLFIIDCLITNSDNLSDIQFKQDILPFIKHIFINNHENNTEILLSTIRLLIVLVEYRSNILILTLAEWLSCLFNFLSLHFSSTTWCTLYSDLINDLLSKIIKQFTPLSKDIVDILVRSSSIISTDFLNQLKLWNKNTDDTRLALFSINLWQSLAILLSRLIVRGHTKGNELLAVIEDAFIVENYSIRSAAYTAWSLFMSHIHQSDDIDPQQLNNRLLKLFLTPFLSDCTSKSKSASISKCHAWITLISIYPKNIHDIILPFLSFAFGNHISSKTLSTTTAWWSECRQIGAQFIHDLLIKNNHGEYIIRIAGDNILNYLFDSIVDQLLEYSTNLTENDEKSLWLISWNAYLNHLINIFKLNNSINENQRVAINTCLLTRMEQLWIDSRIETRFLLKLFETFEQISFPLAIETVLRDSSVRTKTLSAAQIHPSSGNYKSQDKSLSYHTTLSDQYLHMMLEHAIRFNDEDQTNEEAYLHVISYLIDTLSKTSDENFCYQTSSLLLKCSDELSHQPITIPCLFWHIWFRCSTNLINILNRSLTFELNNKIDNQKQETSIELLLRPFAFNDIQRLDYSYTLLWIQLFKALCRLVLINNDQAKNLLIHLLVELLRNEPAFEQAINDQHNQRLFGFILIIIKTLLKTFSDIDLSSIYDRSNNNFVHLFSNTQKRSLPSSSIILCFTQLSTLMNHILQRLLSNNENNTQYILVCNCLFKSNKISSAEQTKLFVFTYIRDLIVDLLNLCKIYSHLEIIFKNLTQLIPFLYLYEQSININLSLGLSPISIHKQQTDNIILNKILTIISSVFEPSNSSSLLQLIYPILILAFQHHKTIMRNKARKCWNETFGRMTFIVYPNELRLCLRDLKDKEHLLLPCFLADHDNSNTAGSGAHPGSTDESQLSQQIDIATPLISTAIYNQQVSKPFLPPMPPSRPINTDKNEPVFIPIMNNINYNNQSKSPVVIGKRLSSANSCLTEKQKEKLRTRHVIPLLCDDNSNTQSNSCTIDTPIIENMMRNHQLRNTDYENKEISTSLPLFKQSMSNNVSQENNTTIEISSKEIEDISEESSTTKKLRRSCRPSTPARKSVNNNTRKKQTDELSTTTSIVSETQSEQIKTHPIKSILKRLSPTKPRQDHKRRVGFHDQVKVLVFASPSRRDLMAQQKKKSPNKDEMKSPTRIIPKENLPLRKQPMSARRLSAMNSTEQFIIPPSPMTSNKTRSSKLFHPNDALADWTQTQEICQLPINSNNENQSSEIKIIDPIFPNLINCDKSVDTLINLLYDGLCPTDVINYFHSNKINTVGDVARSTSVQIETYPIPSPKVVNIEKALSRYEKHLNNSSSINHTRHSLLPTATTLEEIGPIHNNTSTKELSSIPVQMVINSQDKLYDVDTLIDSLDYERLDLNDEVPSSTDQIDSLRMKPQLNLINEQEFLSPQKRCLSPMNEENQNDEISPKKPTIVNLTLGDRLQQAADIYKTEGILPFNDDYIELVRQLFHNSSLTNLEQLHLKTLFLNH
ncbi:unnamed protein product [Adineta steineri]|uniref:Telomere-associated protein Rif1 N-terminal domain-containing protein n=2 Tax=Adineta steineri TaxID=433720 RepID=A0A818REW8_9BILA|nr:unnamed protein product [Adineta steineri]CAF3656205.1 unnamed protein product [Adineta steineri]